MYEKIDYIKYKTLSEYLTEYESFLVSEVPVLFRKSEVNTLQEKYDFIKNHFRYYTMSSWNQSTSFANNIKLRNLNLPEKISIKAYDFLEIEETYEQIRVLIDAFNLYNNYKFQIGFNGKSGGYAVIYLGDRVLSNHKSVCTSCGQKNFKTIEESNSKVCGRCGQATRVNKEFYDIITYSGKHYDISSNFDESEEYEINEMYNILMDFDLVCDIMRYEFISVVENNHIIDEEVLVPSLIKSLRHNAIDLE